MRTRTFTCLAGVLIACPGLSAAQDLEPPEQEFVLEFNDFSGAQGGVTFETELFMEKVTSRSVPCR